MKKFHPRATLRPELTFLFPTDWHQVLSEFVQNITCSETPLTLDPGASFSCSGQYVLTQRDVDHGVVTNEVCVCMSESACLLGFAVFLFMLIHLFNRPRLFFAFHLRAFLLELKGSDRGHSGRGLACGVKCFLWREGFSSLAPKNTHEQLCSLQ